MTIDTSSINPLLPQDSDLQTQDVRDNFDAIKTALDSASTQVDAIPGIYLAKGSNLSDVADAFISAGNIKSGYVVATKAEAAALTLTSADAGRKIFVTSDDGGEFTVEYDVSAPYADDGGSYCGTQFIPSGGDGTIGIVRDYDGAINLLWYGAVGDGTTDDTTPITNWLTAITAGLSGYVPAGTYKFTSALSKETDNFTIFTDDRQTANFLYAGANTTNDIITIGNGTTTYSNITIKGLSLQSDTVMTGGAGIRLKKIVRSEFDVVLQGQDKYEADGNNLYHGIWFDSIDNVWARTREVVAQQDGIRVNGAIANTKSDLTLASGGKVAFCNVGLRVGGAFGGLYLDPNNIINNNTNIIIDQTLVAERNRQIFILGGAVDNAQTAQGIYINDAGPVYVQITGTWIASSATHGVHVSSTTTGKIVIGGAARLFNNGTDGLRVDAAAPIVLIDNTQIHNNGGYGVNPNVASHNVQIGPCSFNTNTSGDINTTNVPASFPDWMEKQIFTATPTVKFATNGDFSPTYNSRTCRYSIDGNRVKFFMEIDFTTNAYTTAAGAFSITHNIKNGTQTTPVSLGLVDNVTFGANTLVYPEIQTSEIYFRALNSGTAASNWNTTNIPASTSNIKMRISGEYEY